MGEGKTISGEGATWFMKWSSINASFVNLSSLCYCEVWGWNQIVCTCTFQELASCILEMEEGGVGEASGSAIFIASIYVIGLQTKEWVKTKGGFFL